MCAVSWNSQVGHQSSTKVGVSTARTAACVAWRCLRSAQGRGCKREEWRKHFNEFVYEGGLRQPAVTWSSE